jgi:hypothetical protein
MTVVARFGPGSLYCRANYETTHDHSLSWSLRERGGRSWSFLRTDVIFTKVTHPQVLECYSYSRLIEPPTGNPFNSNLSSNHQTTWLCYSYNFISTVICYLPTVNKEDSLLRPPAYSSPPP